MRKLLLTTAAALMLTAGIARAQHEEQVTLDRVVFVTSQKWFVLKDMAVVSNVLRFRKYALAVVDDQLTPVKTKNVASFVCAPAGRTWDHLAVHLPGWVKLKTIDERAWVSSMGLRVKMDRAMFTTVGEYALSKSNGDKEFFIDFTEDSRNEMLELLTSSEILIEFGPAQERIEINQMSRTPDGKGDVEGFLNKVVPEISKRIGGGEVRSFSTDSMLKACATFKKTGRFWSDERKR